MDPLSSQRPVNMMMPPERKPSVAYGPIVGAIIIIGLLVFGGLYFWGQHINNVSQSQNLPLILGDENKQSAPIDQAAAAASAADSIQSIDSNLQAVPVPDADVNASLDAINKGI